MSALRSWSLLSYRGPTHWSIMQIFCRGKWKCSKSLTKPNTLIFSTENLIHTLAAPCITITSLHCTESWYQIIDCTAFKIVVAQKAEEKKAFTVAGETGTKWLVALCWKQQAAVFRVWRENTALEKHQAFIANRYSLVLWLYCKTLCVERMVVAFLTSAVNPWKHDLKPRVGVYRLRLSFYFSQKNSNLGKELWVKMTCNMQADTNTANRQLADV